MKLIFQRIVTHPYRVLFVGIVLFACLFQFIGRELLQYDLAALQSGEFYRALTGHFVHLSVFHLVGNIAAMAIILFWLSHFCRFVWVASLLLIGPLGISLLMLLVLPELDWYVGLSGTLYALIFFGLLHDNALNRHFKILLAALLVIHVYFQIAETNGVGWYSQLLGGNVIGESHAFGALIGLIVGMIRHWFQHAR